MLISYKRGQGSIILRVKILNSSVTTGAGLTGLTSASTGLIISTIADNEATATAYTVAASNVETITTLGTYAAPTASKCRFKEVDATNHKGVYEIQLADARFAVSSAKSLLVSIVGATNAAECDAVIPLTDLDPYNSVRAGLTALPNAAAEAAGGLYTRGTGAGQINQPANGQIDANVEKWNATDVPAEHTAGYPIVTIKDGTGTGELDTASGVVLAKDHTGANLATASALTTVQTDTDDIQTRLPAALVGGRMDASVGAYASGQVPVRISASGTADSGSTTTVVDTERTEADTDYWAGHLIKFTSGTLAGQSRLITAFNAATDTITFTPALTVAAGTHTYEILPHGRVDVELWDGSTVNSLIAGRVDANAQVVGDKTGYSVSTVSPGAITTGSFVAGAIDAAVIANGAIDAATFAAGAIDAAAIATGAIDADAIAVNAITSAKIATDAIGSAQLAQSAADKVISAVSGTTDSGTTTTIVDTERTEADTDYWAGSAVLITSGPNVGQIRRISAFNATTDTITVATAFTQAMAVGNTYIILRSSGMEAPGAGATDWTTAEKNQIRHRLGIDGTTAAPADTVHPSLRMLASGTSDSGSTTTMVDAARTEADTDYWKGSWIVFTSGTLLGQARLITAFNAATDTITFAPATTVAVATHEYEIRDAGAVDVRLWNGTAPSNLISGRVDSNAQVVGTGAIVSGSFAAGAIDNAAFNVTETLTANPAAGGITSASFAAGAIDAAAIAPDAIGSSELAGTAVDEIVNALWDELTSESRTAGSYGQLFKDNVNATISSRSSHSAADVWTSATRTLTAFSFSVTVGTNNDKTGYSLTTLESMSLHSGTAQAGAAGTVTLASGASATNDLYVGEIVRLYGATGAGQSRTITAYNGTTKVATVDRNWTTNPDSTTTYSVDAADNPDLDASLQIARVALTDVVTTYTGNTPQTGDAYAVVNSGTFGNSALKTLIDTLTGYVDTEVAAIKAKTDGLNFTGTKVNAILLRWLTDDAAGTPNALITGKVDASATASISSADKDDIVDRVWDEAIAGHLTAGTTGNKLNAAGTAADPWSTALPGSYASGTAGNIIGSLERRGAGSVHYEMVIKTAGGTPIDGVEVYVTTDSGGSNVVAGTLITDALGKVTFQLDAGTYYAWRQRSGYNFTNPQTFTVS